MDLSEGDKKKYEPVKTKFDEHFSRGRNVIYERAKFNSRRQQDGETVDQFVTALHTLAENCSYGQLHEEMIRDQLLVGLRDMQVSMKLQLDPELTLKRAVTAACQSEAVKHQQSVVRGPDQSPNVDRVIYKKKSQPRKSTHPHPPPVVSPKQQSLQKDTCTRCGKSPLHSRQQCPAREAIFRKCSKKGHYQSVCRSKEVNTIELDCSTLDSDNNFLGAVETNTADKPTWSVTVSINSIDVNFKIDTGADVTVIPKSVFKKLNGVELQPCCRSLSGPCQHNLEVCGKFTGVMQYNKIVVEQEVFVIRELHRALIGLPAIEALELVHRVSSITSDIPAKFPELFQGLGSLPGEYTIRLRDNAKPFTITTPRRVALPLLPRVKAELEKMEKTGVISRVDVPTEWCTAMVVVPKPDGRIRICVDLLN